MNLPRTMGAMDHGGLHVGGLAGAGNKGHAVGQAFRFHFGVEAQKRIQLLEIPDDLREINDTNVNRRDQGNRAGLPRTGAHDQGSRSGHAVEESPGEAHVYASCGKAREGTGSYDRS